ncbi:hypothetical protein GN156_13285 [bacterium LRH843]|nr:hypothetical protein [bacterium LRH843]
MFLEFMQGIAIFYYWTWFVWPFVFIISFAYGLTEMIKNEHASLKSIFLAGVSLLIILAGVTAPAFG